MSRATTCAGWTGGRTAGRTGSSSRSSRPIRTSAAAWCWTPAARWISAPTGVTKIEYARRIAGTIGHLALQQGDAVGLTCLADGIVRNIPPRRNPSHLMAIFDVLEQAKPQGETQLVSVLHELAETIRQRALIVIISDLFVEPEQLRSCFQHLRFRKHDVAVFHLLDPQEVKFDFRRPMRFLDMEGGPSIFAEPNEIAERYHKAIGGYLEGLQQVVLESAVDYHRVSIDESYEQLLIRFLVGRTRSKGVTMSFLQPMLLAALPLVALPIIIHLINQRRYQTVRWAAMMFLLAANRMSRGYARIRQWLIMAMRMAAIAGLIFAISRPLAGGWLGLAGGGRADTTIDPDRPLPQHAAGRRGAGGSKLETGLTQLSRTLATLGSARWVLIDSRRPSPRELDSIDELPRLPSTGPSSASADVPAMLQAARDYIKANKVGPHRDLDLLRRPRANDWNADSGRWQALRDEFQEFPQGVRFHLLAYPQAAPRNLSVRVTERPPPEDRRRAPSC